MHDSALPVVTTIAIILLLLAGSAQWRARNLGTLLNIGWTLAGNLSFLLNTLIWRDHSRDAAPVFCDISVKVQTGLHTGISAASLCITRRLAAIASSQSVNVSQRRKRINFCIDLGCGVGLPLVVMGVSYVVQVSRFMIYEGYGCDFPGAATIPTIFLVFMWPLLLSTISAVYGGIAIYHFVSKRLEFRTLLKSSNSGLDTGQFIRLLCLASADIAIAVPIDIYLIVRNGVNILPYSWSDVHYAYSTPIFIPASLWLESSQFVIDVALWRYMLPMLGFILFVLIGMTEDSTREYMRNGQRLWYAVTGKRQHKSILPPPVNLGSTVGRVDGFGSVINSAKSPHNTAFDIEPSYDSPTSPRFKDHNRRVGVKVEQEIV